jgi:hypothetical protein
MDRRHCELATEGSPEVRKIVLEAMGYLVEQQILLLLRGGYACVSFGEAIVCRRKPEKRVMQGFTGEHRQQADPQEDHKGPKILLREKPIPATAKARLL